MKTRISLLSLGLLIAATAAAQTVSGLHISNLNVQREGDKLNITLNFDPRSYRQSLNQQTEITPVLVAKGDSTKKVEMPSFAVAGKNSYYHTLRNGGDGKGEALYRSGKGSTVTYTQTIDWSDWMQSSRLDFVACTTGCCGAPTIPPQETPAAELDFVPKVYEAVFEYVAPVASGDKIFNLEGQAFINFPVNRTEIYPDYMSNPTELRKILDTIDAVKGNPDAKVNHIKLTGYASPEGPYNNNVRLAKGRTEALKEYVRKQYNFPDNIFETASVPEDWAGLRKAVEISILPQKQAIIDFIDADYPIVTRNDRLRKEFPADYAWLLKNVYPSLRHTDYVITYEVRKYTDVEEIKRVMKTRPQNLSLNEFFLAAQTFEPGSKEYDEVFDIAVRMFPENETANLNAANAAMNHGDLMSAEKFLERAGDSPQSAYARGVLAAKKKNYEKAILFFRDAEKGGMQNATKAIKEIETLKGYAGEVTYINS